MSRAEIVNGVVGKAQQVGSEPRRRDSINRIAGQEYIGRSAREGQAAMC